MSTPQLFDLRGRTALVTGGAQGPLCDTFAADGPFADIVRQVSLRLITDDGAALTGLARLATA